MKIKESLNVTFDENPPPYKTTPLVDDDLDLDEAIKNVSDALKDESWVVAMQEELNQFISNDVWDLVPSPKNMTIIGTKWVFRNKLDENGIVSQNEAMLVAQGYNQQEGINHNETYAPVARLESIRILLAYTYALNFKLFQMDVKSAVLNGFINEEVYVAQTLGFIDSEKPNHVYKLKKALFDLKQDPKAWFKHYFQITLEYFFIISLWPCIPIGKSCHLPIELEHKAYWALKHAKFDRKTAGDHRKLQLNELNELRDQDYENSLIYKERTKKLHNSKIKNRTKVGHRVKHYFGEDLPPKVVQDLHTFSKDE
ncbi:retrovirus-related pol polyprotein from transposon TNT 1-94 [Tanacetum coccineum]|uniref:Retrovirus-related pol polyprotein from transposon TNT 1-94 n=1 Tax=Tanacetum coccineum TaxID=301880 RepID=A0ABQ5J1Z1_9ASTR